MYMIFLLDLNLFLLLLVLANLSRRIGEALMIPSIYRLLYICAGVIAVASLTDIIIKGLTIDLSWIQLITISMRAFGALFAIPVCIRYWKWLFYEDLKG